MTRGLASVIAAAQDIDEVLAGKTHSWSETVKTLATYLDRRRQYHRLEQRWPEAIFWKRRQGIDWSAAPLMLDPRTILECREQEPTPVAIAPLECLLPPRALRATLERLRTPCHAHEALSLLRSLAPLGDRQLLVGLQELVTRGFVAAQPPA